MSKTDCLYCKIERLEQQLQQAHKRGWEQCKAEAVKTCSNHRDDYGFGAQYVTDGIGKAIAAMEYKEG